MPDDQHGSDTILHQGAVEGVVTKVLQGWLDVNDTEIDSATVITGGQSPTEAEHNEVVGILNLLLTALDGAGLISLDV